MGSFTLLDFGNPLGTMLYTGTWRHGSVLVGEQNLPGVASDPSAVAEYSAEYDHLARCSALSPDESARFIEEAAVRHARAGAVGEALSLARRPSGPEPGDLEPGA